MVYDKPTVMYTMYSAWYTILCCCRTHEVMLAVRGEVRKKKSRLGLRHAGLGLERGRLGLERGGLGLGLGLRKAWACCTCLIPGKCKPATWYEIPERNNTYQVYHATAVRSVKTQNEPRHLRAATCRPFHVLPLLG